MIDSDEVLRAVCGSADVEAFKRVKVTSMRIADIARRVIADELHGQIPETGKQFLITERGTWRLASRANSDNSTEESAHRHMGARPVQMFGELTAFRRSRGWISIEELYAIHGLEFRPRPLMRRISKHVPLPPDGRPRVKSDADASRRPVVRSTKT